MTVVEYHVSTFFNEDSFEQGIIDHYAQNTGTNTYLDQMCRDRPMHSMTPFCQTS